MSEIAFAKQFLATLDSKPIKLSSDSVADPRKLPAQSPYTLPRIQHAFPKRQRLSDPSATSALAGASARSDAQPTSTNTIGLNVTLKPLRAGPSTPSSILIQGQSRITSVYDLKTQAAARTGYTPDKVKILWERKPVLDSKTIGEIVGSELDNVNVEMGIMFVGAPTRIPVASQDSNTAKAGGGDESVARPADATAASKTNKEALPVAQGIAGEQVLETEEFWTDLQAFVVKRIRDEGAGQKLIGQFKEHWKSKTIE